MSNFNFRDLRKKLSLNQTEFWGKVGVTQSGGSRYESGRTAPKQVAELVRLVHQEGIDLVKIKREDLEISALLKEQDPELYKALKKAAKSQR